MTSLWSMLLLPMLVISLAFADETPFHTQTITPFPISQSGFFSVMQNQLANEPALRYQLMFASFVSPSWTVPPGSGSMTQTIPTFEAIVNGYYVNQPDTIITYAASARTFVYVDWFDTRLTQTPPLPEVTRVSGGTGCNIPIRLTRLLVITCASSSSAPILSVPQVMPLYYVDTGVSSVTASVKTAPIAPVVGGGGGGTPVNGPYILKTPVTELTSAQALSLLPSGLLLNTTGTGDLSTYGGVSCANQVLIGLSAAGIQTCIKLTEAYLNASNVDGAANVPSLRTLGTGAQQATAGNDGRLSDARTPLAHASSHNPTGTDDISAIYATKAYADSISAGLHVHASVMAATTANITLSGTQTVDGVALTVTIPPTRVLVKNQTTAATNGIYDVASGPWPRSSDADQDPEVLTGLYTFVTQGGQGGTGWILTTPAPITVGLTTLTFTQFSGGGTIVGGSGLVLSGNTLDVGAGTCITVGADTVGVSAGCLTNTEMSATIQDPVAGTPGLRTLGTGAQQAAAGNDSRLSDQRTPADNSVTSAKIVDGAIVNVDINSAAAIAESKLALASDAAAGVASRRTLGTGALQAAAGNDARLTDQRTPLDSSVTSAKIADGTILDVDVNAGAAIQESKLSLASDAVAGTASRRTLGTGAQQAAAGNDGRFPTASEKFALAGTAGTPSDTNRFVTDADTRFVTKPAAQLATTATITLSGEQTIDGVLTSTSRVLVKNQTTTTQNGLYLSAAGAWVRTTDSPTAGAFSAGLTIPVINGTLNRNTVWMLDTSGTWGASAATFTRSAPGPAGEVLANKNVGNGYLGLDASAKVPWNLGQTPQVAPDISAVSQIDAASLQASLIGIRSTTAGNVLMTTGNPRITGCTAGNAGQRLTLVGLDPVRTVEIPTGNGLLLPGGVGTVKVGRPPGGTTAEFFCNSNQLWEQLAITAEQAYKAKPSVPMAVCGTPTNPIFDGGNGNTWEACLDASNNPTWKASCAGVDCPFSTVQNLAITANGAQPTCNATIAASRVPFWPVIAAGQTTRIDVCKKNNADVYAWTDISSGAGVVERSVIITNSAPQTITVNDTPITFDTEIRDTDTMHSTSSNTSRITFTTAGMYTVMCHGRWQAGTDLTDVTALDGYLRLNGATVLPGAQRFDPQAQAVYINPSVIWNFAANDYVEFVVTALDASTGIVFERTAGRFPYCEAVRHF